MLLFLQLGHPQAVEVAVCIHSDGLFAAHSKGNFGSFTGLESLAGAAAFGLNVNLFDEVLFHHGVSSGTDGNLDGITVYGDNGQVLFSACFHSVGNESIHLLTAAHHGNACVVYHADEVAAMAAAIELVHNVFLLNCYIISLPRRAHF